MRPGTAIFVMLPLVLVVGAFVLVATRGAGAGPSQDGLFWDEQIARYIRQKVAMTYVDELDEERSAEAFYKAMDAYVQDLDDYCDFIPPEEHRRWRESSRGEYAGLGVKIQRVDEGLLISGLLAGGPAAKAGIEIGDTLVSSDGKPLAGVSVSVLEATQLLKGKPGTRVVLTVLKGPRGADDPAPPGPMRQIPVVRAVVRPPTVFSRRVGEFGVIRLTEFAEATEADFDAALKAMLAQNVAGLILDLRGNGGGVLPTAVGVVDRFVTRGVIVRMEGRTAHANRVYEARPETVVAEAVPLVVLVDGGSASASEVVAGALQDHRRALLVGDRTYGKFLVQQVTDIPGHEAALQLTTSRYYLPSGRSYQRTAGTPLTPRRPGQRPEGAAGMLPDIVVPITEEAYDEQQMFRRNEEAKPWGEAKPFPDVADDHVDPQLSRAMELLRGELALRRIRSGRPSRPQ